MQECTYFITKGIPSLERLFSRIEAIEARLSAEIKKINQIELIEVVFSQDIIID